MTRVGSLSAAWLHAKEEERQANIRRLAIEEQLLAAMDVPAGLDGTMKSEIEGYEVKFIGRMNRKIDSDKLQDVAAEHGLTEQLGSLFRWKPEIIAAAWKAADSSITSPLLAAITTTPGKPTVSITTLEKE